MAGRSGPIREKFWQSVDASLLGGATPQYKLKGSVASRGIPLVGLWLGTKSREVAGRGPCSQHHLLIVAAQREAQHDVAMGARSDFRCLLSHLGAVMCL